ncbi:MAG: Sorbitol dehydrogenase [Firmicutes bacterium ADurb.Bin193]|nr:MAG: Sorbitol dehydrogenase [Firmicutes bacterium ADurb.Bin193]
MKGKRAYLVKPGKFEIREEEVSYNQDEVLVKVAVCGLCNWELNHWFGYLGTCPQTLGHEWAGEIVEVGSRVTNFKVGDKICYLPGKLEGFSQYAAASEDRCIKISEEFDIHKVLGEPLKDIVTVLKAAAAEPGDCGIVVGCGPMGLWCTQALSGNTLSCLIAVDIDDSKLALAKKFGATHTVNPKNCDAIQAISDITGGHMGDFVIEGTGNPGVLNQCIYYLKPTGRGRLLLMSSHETATKEFDFRPAVERSIDLRVPHPGHSLNQMEDLRRAVSLLEKGSFKIDGMITHEFSLDEINEGFRMLENKPKDYIKGIVLPWR